jgi:hypothetical protein
MSVDERELLVAEFLQPLAGVEPVLRPATVPAPRSRGRVVVAFALVGLLALAVAVIAIRRPAPGPAPSHPAPRPLTRDRVIVTTLGVSIRPWGQQSFRQIVTTPIAGAQISPDGSTLAFITVASGRCSLRLMSLVDAGLRTLGTCDAVGPTGVVPSEPSAVAYGGTAFTINPQGGWGPTWSPDSRRVAWLCETRPPGTGMLCIADRAGTTSTVAVPRGFGPVWSPDGTTIAYLADPAIRRSRGYPFDLEAWLMAPDGSQRRRASVRGQRCCLAVSPSLGWSPDSTKLLVLATNYNRWTAQVIDIASRKSTFYPR